MFIFNTFRFVCCLFLFGSAIAQEKLGSKEFVIIRNSATGLVLEDTDNVVLVQAYTGFDEQQWLVVPTKYGSYIINKQTAKVMSPSKKDSEYIEVITDYVNGYDYQKWVLNDDQTISNACGTGNVINILGESTSPGTSVIMSSVVHKRFNQLWTFETVSL